MSVRIWHAQKVCHVGLHTRLREHAVNLAPMMGLVIEKVQEKDRVRLCQVPFRDPGIVGEIALRPS
jgi:hypothetical protein